MNCAFSLDLGLDPRQSDQAVPALARAVAPQFLAGILIAAPFAAVMSTVDSALLVVSASFVRDLLQKTYLPNLSTSATRRLSYLATALTGVVVFLIAREERPFLLPLVIHFTGGAASVLFWPSLATLFWRRATRQGVLAGLIGGATIYIAAVAFDPFGNIVRLHPFMYGFPASALLVVIGSLMSPKQTDIRLNIYFGRTPQTGR
jgi:sodium/pantothenate symporter